MAASSGPKNLVIVIDTSGSMEFASRITIAREAAKTVLDTLTFADYVNIVTVCSSHFTVFLIAGITFTRALSLDHITSSPLYRCRRSFTSARFFYLSPLTPNLPSHFLLVRYTCPTSVKKLSTRPSPIPLIL